MSQPQDWKARAAITGKADLATNMIVRAGAGSGKTTALIDRIVALLGSGSAPSSIVAITFTRLAAAELKGRLHARLNHMGVPFSDDLFIGTIHSFCTVLLKRHPFDIGLAPDFRVVEDDEAARAQEEFWQAFISRPENAPELDFLQRAGCTDDMLTNLFKRAGEYEDLETETGAPDEEPDLSGPLSRAVQILDVLDGLGPFHTRPDKVQVAARRARLVLRMVASETSTGAAAVLGLFAGMARADGSKLHVTLNRWSLPTAVAKCLRDGLDHDALPLNVCSVISRVILPALVEWKAWVHARATRFVEGATGEYAALRRRTGHLTHNDLLHLAARLTGTSPAARESFQAEFGHILVDEFQDTDPTQAKMLFWLASRVPDENDWSESPLMPGRLFLVGDDKQSIYRFRRADFEVFKRCEAAILAQGGRSLSLTTNFRATPVLCNWINAALKPLFDASDHQAPYELLEAYKPASPASVVGWMTYEDKLSAAEEVRNEARVIARIIRDELDVSDGAPGDYMILLRRNSKLPVYVAELSMAGLPVTVSGGEVTGGSDVLAAVCSVLTWAANSRDGLATAAALRSLFMGASDADLLDWRQGGSHVVDALLEQLGSMANILLERSPHEALSTITSEFGWWMLLATRPSANMDIGVLQRILARVRDRESRGYNWLECLAELVDVRDGKRSMALHAARKETTSSVQVMTVHQAKGLQAKTVFLADPGLVKRRTPEKHFFTSGGRSRVTLPVLDASPFGSRVAFAPRQWDARAAKEQEVEQSEQIRLLYVACTRAEERLIVTIRKGGATGYWDSLAPFLEQEGTQVASISGTESSMTLPVEQSRGFDAAQALDRIASRRSRIRTLSAPGYRVVRPSDERDRSADSVVPHGHGPGGKAYGQAVHEAFEWLVNHRDTPQPDVPFGADIAKAISGLRESRLWEQILQAEDVLTEVPFTTGLRRQDGILDVVSGTIDLALRFEGHWLLVDYKTDRLEETRLLTAYRGQLGVYAECWRLMFQDETVEAALWSTWKETLTAVQP